MAASLAAASIYSVGTGGLKRRVLSGSLRACNTITIGP
jgi:hypothetical protein